MPSYDERNKADFEAATRRLEEALATLARDESIPATVKALAKLAGCSHSTLYLRKWPIEKLWEIRRDRKEKLLRTRRRKRITSEDRLRGDQQADERQELAERLKQAEGVTVEWVERYLSAASEIRKQDKLIRDLRVKTRHLESDNQELRKKVQELQELQLKQTKNAKVVALRSPRSRPARSN